MIAKGKAFISAEKLAELFNLPKGVEILAVRPKEALEGFEFLLVSNETTIVTKDDSMASLVRFPVPLATGGIVKGQIQLENYTGNIEPPPLQKKEELINNFQKKLAEDLKSGHTINITFYNPKRDDRDNAEKIVEEIKRNLGKITP